MTIKQKQWQLWYLSYYGGRIDGVWGSMSRAATVRFQEENGLDPDGVFGTLTREKSMEIIRGIQEAVGTVVDGLAGTQTNEATAVWQAAHGLAADGIAGPLTRAAMEAEVKDFWDGIKHFTREEFACKCGKHCNGYPVEMQRKVVEVADRAREHFGAAAHVSSGLRCEKHNKAVGGVFGSRHKLGKAMDFRVEGRTAAQVLEFVKRQPEIRYCYAIDKNYVHMDVV